MVRSLKQAGQLLLAVAVGSVLSFSATRALSAPEQVAEQLNCPDCVSICMEQGSWNGKCIGGECWCF